MLGLVFLNGFFVAAEFALVKVRGSRIDSLAEEGNRKAKFAKGIMNNLDAYLSACQLGITLTSLGLGYVGEPTFAKILEPLLGPLNLPESVFHTITFLIAFTLMTTLHITLGEQVPKIYAIRKSEQVTLISSGPLVLFYKIMYPFIWSLNGLSNWMLRRVGIEPTTEHESAHTEEEIRVLMKESHKNGLIDKTELTLVDNIFDFAETTAKEIMIPRTEMECLYAGLSFSENLSIAIKEMRTRYPVCDPDKDNIIGFVHIKDLLKPDANLKGIKKIIRPITTVPDSIHISDLLKMMQKRKSQMALLIDEYGGTSGLVTLEDIMEEIVGEIQDEFDEERPTIEVKDDNTFSIDGLLLIDEVNDYFGTEIESDDYDTIGGWIYAQIEIPPSKNQQVTYNDELTFIVEETDHLRISRVKVRKNLEQNEVLEQNIS
ncbi:hemolysin family protein [Paenibacillus sedimenti]|uniref:HlyC/CorC family transporter n=1 Tax=Paenibacillus sedimenti TaxID=2770274 RepID=A0A926KKU5_9BACL|nr:hemolysin family protein [Paenibacillus sedimenti]MBD0379132.1 HlyC/CorC family transporter [Paenibacillus sedimenti]